MYGMNPKMKLRQKALSMHDDAPSISIKVKKGMPGMEDEESGEESGFISMMVSPEEKKMILSMRNGEDSEENESGESIEDVMGA